MDGPPNNVTDPGAQTLRSQDMAVRSIQHVNRPWITPARRIVKRTVGSKGQPAITISNIRIPANDGISGVRRVDSKKISAGAAAYAPPSAGIGLVGCKAEQIFVPG